MDTIIKSILQDAFFGYQVLTTQLLIEFKGYKKGPTRVGLVLRISEVFLWKVIVSNPVRR